ncbi:acetyl-CoA carboxylase [Roseovarius aquimarinus]|uniref:Biotin carboxyl carrier protein of acetyl-CoA carboxylase n=1 Tax=Roseovarius aquimarinus TaxID=1229156 RepID=A0ABW7I6P4_9RHOB
MADIQSPVPGTFYHRPSPEDAPFKSTGDAVKAGDTIGLVEVMKSFIEVQAEADGTFGGYTAENEAAVSAGDVLATLK